VVRFKNMFYLSILILGRIKMENFTKTQIGIFVIMLLYVLGFGIHFLSVGNFEFVWYIFIMLFLISMVALLHKYYHFPTLVLGGFGVWGLLHMLGGSVYINGVKLYGAMLWNIIPSQSILKYDQFVHFYCYIIITLMLFYIFRSYLKENYNWLVVSVLLVFMGMGVGAFNEIIEFMPVLFLEDTGVGGYFNIAWDIVFNTLGAIVAVVILKVKGRLK